MFKIFKGKKLNEKIKNLNPKSPAEYISEIIYELFSETVVLALCSDAEEPVKNTK